MVKVERKGKIRYIYCEGCNSILSFSEKDKQYRSEEDWYNEYIICPECGKKVTVLDVCTIGGNDYRSRYDKKRIEDV